MTQVTFWDADSGELILTAPIKRNDSVMEVAIREGVEGIIAECGGSMSCGTCHVFADPAESSHFEEKDISEEDMLVEIEGRQPNSRLSCQMLLLADTDATLNVRVPAAE